MSTDKAVKMIADCESGTVTFCIRNNFIWVEVDHYKEGFFTSNINWAGRGMYLAAEMLDVDLWPAFVERLKPVNIEDQIAKSKLQDSLEIADDYDHELALANLVNILP